MAVASEASGCEWIVIVGLLCHTLFHRLLSGASYLIKMASFFLPLFNISFIGPVNPSSAQFIAPPTAHSSFLPPPAHLGKLCPFVGNSVFMEK